MWGARRNPWWITLPIGGIVSVLQGVDYAPLQGVDYAPQRPRGRTPLVAA